jgi:drug/metabolite transporter (DMT)-like permease
MLIENKTLLAAFITVGLSITAVIADYFLKRASEFDLPYSTYWFWIGLLIYASTAFGTVFVFQHMKLAISGAIYSVSFALFLTALGASVFKEGLTSQEAAGVAMAIGSFVLLNRFV